MPTQFLENYSAKPQPTTQVEPEPRVLTEDVSSILKHVVHPEDDDIGISVSLVAEKARTSTRTVYRVLSESTKTISLDLADRLCLASKSHLSDCRLQLPDGTVVAYFDTV